MTTSNHKRLMLHLALLAILFLPALACNLTESDTPTRTPIPPTPTESTELPNAMPLAYYYFVPVASGTYPAGSVSILPDELILGPTFAELTRTDDIATNIRGAVQAALDDARNVWTGKMTIAEVRFENGAAYVVLEGEIAGAGDVVLIAARMQILLTVFAESVVQSAVITLNGENIGNWGISHSSEAKPADYAYTRAEIEAFMSANAYPPD